MKRSGASKLPLHGGSAPPWLVGRMKKLAKPIVRIIVEEYGRTEFLKRLSDPYWFQSIGCVLGYDWHSSGLTTVTTGVLKDVIEPNELGIFGAGGKGKTSMKTPEEIEIHSNTFSFSSKRKKDMIYASKTSAKVDNSAIQAGAPLYHHAFFGSEDGEWTIIQQGMDTENRIARRYHWTSDGIESFVDEPHAAILTEKRKSKVLDMTSKRSEECKKTSTDLVKDKPKKVRKLFKSITSKGQKTLDGWMPDSKRRNPNVPSFSLPKRLNWKALENAYELQPKNYEDLLTIDGIGPATVRGLALVSEIIYGESASWRDPAKFSFAFGGKDGVPYPVNRKSMDKAHSVLKSAIEQSEVGKKEKIKAIKRLRELNRES